MGCTYTNVTVVGSSLETVRTALAGSGALLAEADGGIVVFSPYDEAEGIGGAETASQLSAVLQVPAVAALVFDDDVLHIQVFVGGAIAATAIAPPTGIDTAPDGDDAAAGLVAALGRGDAGTVRAALANDSTFASESHAEVFAALELPTDGVGWGHGYLSRDPELFEGTLHDA